MTVVISPFPQFFTTAGDPLNSGYIYFGVMNANPETSPVTVYWDEALTQPAAQPLRTSGGMVMRAGTPALVYASGNYSMTVRDSAGALVFYAPTPLHVDTSATLAAALADTSSSANGDALLGVKLDATGAVATTQHQVNQEQVSAFRFMTPAQIADVQAGTLLVDVTSALNAALAYLKTTNGGRLWLPRGNYYTTATVGNAPQTTTDWNDNTEIIGEKGATITIIASFSGTVLSLNGNNVAIRNVAINSKRTIDHHADLVAQRVVYQLGIIIGGKIGVGTLATFKSGAQVTGCTITNMNEPLTATMASNVVISDNTIDEFTDTGIMIQDCTTDVWVERNNVTRGGDDNIFIRHYPTTPWALAGNYCGRVKVRSNILNDTFGKNCGITSYGDVEISGNYMGLSWAGGINLEKDGWYNSNAACFRTVQITDNIVVDAGRNFNTAEAVAAHRVATPGENPSAIHSVYLNTGGAINWSNITISGNKIVNPYRNGIALSATDYVTIEGNTFTAGSTNHGGGAVTSTGAALYADTVNHLYVQGNAVPDALGVQFANVYALANGGGSTDILIQNNHERYSSAAASYADATVKGLTIYKRPAITDISADRGNASVTLQPGVDATVQRFATALTAARTITLSTTDAYKGDRFRVLREAGATGAFNLDVGGLKTLAAASQWCEVEYSGTAWVQIAYGAL